MINIDAYLLNIIFLFARPEIGLEYVSKKFFSSEHIPTALHSKTDHRATFLRAITQAQAPLPEERRIY
jgi:hypothetical protein